MSLTISEHVLGILESREPTVDEMERFLGDRDELPVGEPYPLGWPTIRRCHQCRTPVAGGPTKCRLCVAIADANERADICERVLLDAIECGRIAVVQPPTPKPPPCSGCSDNCNCPCGDHFCGCPCHTATVVNGAA